MNKEFLKKALLKGILYGLGLALIVPLIRMLIRGGSYQEHLLSPFGISSMICFPIAWVIYFYTEQKKPKDEEKK